MRNILTSLFLTLYLSLFSSQLFGQVIFDPTPYLSGEDLPAEFCEECQVEDFEDNNIDSFLTFDCGEILLPNVEDPRIPGVQITDSVDGDDGEIDGSGNGGHSFFCVDPAKSITVTFENPVAAAGAVWTDGDRGVSIQVEAFDIAGNSLAASEPVQVADASYFGETAEDRFLGIQSDLGIGAITISTIGRGAGIEIDHVTWDSKELPEIADTPEIDQICSAIATSNTDLQFDANGDGIVSLDDITFTLDQLGTKSGDLDLDGTVAFSDFLAFSRSFGSTTPSYTQGDLDCNGSVAFSDFLTLSRNFGFTSEGDDVANAPEPSTGLLLAWTATLLLAFRRRR